MQVGWKCTAHVIREEKMVQHVLDLGVYHWRLCMLQNPVKAAHYLACKQWTKDHCMWNMSQVTAWPCLVE